ncbi:hypothetical protein [Hugenholtzia roseola]|uniref:hypothetical protein n=1 Tax=Hugenholtzia roseola TaxID=1002 RepID=UPI000421B847|nr:hypothetical protein [Hugenholtzia roseola]
MPQITLTPTQLAEMIARYERRLALITKEAEDIRSVLAQLKQAQAEHFPKKQESAIGIKELQNAQDAMLHEDILPSDSDLPLAALPKRRGKRINWEEFILEHLAKKGSLMFKKELRLLAFKDERIGDRNREQVDRALSAALFKLGKEIGKLQVEGKKGLVYGLPHWFDAQGNPLAQYLPAHLNPEELSPLTHNVEA